MPLPRGSRAPGVAIAVALAGVCGFAQHQINRQVGQPVYGGSGGGGGGTVRYGYVAPVAPRSANLLPSEVRNMQFRSGALPSEIRGNYASIGPLAPGGAAAYIPGGSPVVIRAGAAPQGNLVNPMVSPMGAVPSSPSLKYGTSPGQTAWSTPLTATVPGQQPPPQHQLWSPSPNMSGNPFGTIHYPNAR